MKIINKEDYKKPLINRNSNKSIFNNVFEKELKENLLIAFKSSDVLVLDFEELQNNLTSESKNFNQRIAQKLKDICKDLEIGYNGIVTHNTNEKVFIVDLRQIPNDTFNIKSKSN